MTAATPYSFAGVWIRHQIDQLQLPLDDPDALHDRRVAARRLGVACDLFPMERPGKRHLKALKALTRIMGVARQWDVQESLLARLRETAGDPLEQAALEVLQARARKRRKRAWEKILATPISRKLVKALVRFAGRVEASTVLEPVSAFARKALQPLLLAFMGLRENLFAAEDAERMHQARKAFKRFRYALELLHPALSEGQKGLLDGAREVQTQLGDHHDLVVLQAFLEREGKRFQRPQRVALLAGIGRCLDRVRCDREANYQAFIDRQDGGAG